MPPLIRPSCKLSAMVNVIWLEIVGDSAFSIFSVSVCWDASLERTGNTSVSPFWTNRLIATELSEALRQRLFAALLMDLCVCSSSGNPLQFRAVRPQICDAILPYQNISGVAREWWDDADVSKPV